MSPNRPKLHKEEERHHSGPFKKARGFYFMCCFLGRAEVMHSDHGTQILSGIVDHAIHGRIAVMYYRNTVKSWGPNAMLLPIRAEGWIEKENIFDLRGGSDPLNTASLQIWPPMPEMRMRSKPLYYGSSDLIGASLPQPRFTVENVGDYTVVVANRASLIPEALEQVPTDRRPPLNRKVLKFMEDNYTSDGFKIVLACWNGMRQTASMGLWYQPELDIEGYLRVPAFDYHDKDDRLEFGAPVHVDHQLMFGTPEFTSGLRIDWRSVKDELHPFLPPVLAGIQRGGFEPNGDFGIKIDPVLATDRLLAHESVVRLSADRIIRKKTAV